MKTISTAFILFVSLMIQAQTTYYIDPNGNNGNNGSISSPWLTLNYACTHAKTFGDIIHVNAGTFLETVQSELAVGVSIEGEGVTSIIKSHVGGTSNTILLYNGVENTNGNQHISNIKMDGDALTGYGAIQVINRGNVEINNCTIVDFNYFGVQFLGGKAPPVTAYATGNKFHDNSITNCSAYVGTYPGGDSKGALYIGGQDGLLIYNNTIIQDRADGMNGNIIDAVEGYLKNIKIYNNSFFKTFAYRVTWDFAIEFWNCRGGIEIYNNNINGSIDIGGQSNTKGSSTYSIWIHDNIIGQAKLGAYENLRGILLESTVEDVIVERNEIKNVCIGIYFSQVQNARSVKNIKISCNILNNIGVSDEGLDQKGWGIYWTQETTTNHTVDNINIWNNVLIGHKGARTNMWGIGLPCIGKATNISIRNNIVQSFNYTPIFANNAIGISIDYLSIENNIFFNNGNNNLCRFNEINPTHNTTQNNLITNPRFVSSTDFHLQETSLAIGAGSDVGLTTDKDGVVWIKPPSIGAYEFPRIIENRPPSIRDQGFQLNQNSPVGTVVGIVIASDPDQGQTLAFSILSGNTNGAFSINALTGELSVTNSAALNIDFELVVMAQDNGLGELSNQATVAIHFVNTGIKLTGNSAIIKVYPNPISDELTIEFKGNNNRIGFNILNSTGQIVLKGDLIEKTVIQTTSFSPGVYLMKIEGGRTFEFRKIVKV